MADPFSDVNLPSGVYMVNTPLGRVRSDAVFKGVGQQNEGSALRADQMLSWRPNEGSPQWAGWGNIYNYGGGTDEAFALDMSRNYATAAPAPAPKPSGGGGGGGSPAPSQPAIQDPYRPITPKDREEVSPKGDGLENTIKTKKKLGARIEKTKRTFLTSASEQGGGTFLTRSGA